MGSGHIQRNGPRGSQTGSTSERRKNTRGARALPACCAHGRAVHSCARSSRRKPGCRPGWSPDTQGSAHMARNSVKSSHPEGKWAEAGPRRARREAWAASRRAGGAAGSADIWPSLASISSASARPRRCAGPAERARRGQNQERVVEGGGLYARGGVQGEQERVGSRL